MRILTINAGSTSCKISLLDGAELTAEAASLDATLKWDLQIDVVAHRVVHGGARTGPVLLDDAAVAELAGLTELAPLHQPAALEAIDRCRRELPDVSHFACFDTSFHTSIPEAASTYALPERLRRKVRVFGFHGLAHSWATSQVQLLAPDAKRLVVAHLGGGQSLCAVRDGRSVYTTMGFTPLDGLVMATRSGSIDPGALLWLSRHTDEDLDRVLSEESGLLGLCGTADMRKVIERREAGEADAQLAFDVYIHRLVTMIGSCVAALGGIDALAFSGGVGENSRVVREAVAEHLEWLGTVPTFVIHTREDLEMARLVEGLRAAT